MIQQLIYLFFSKSPCIYGTFSCLFRAWIIIQPATGSKKYSYVVTSYDISCVHLMLDLLDYLFFAQNVQVCVSSSLPFSLFLILSMTL